MRARHGVIAAMGIAVVAASCAQARLPGVPPLERTPVEEEAERAVERAIRDYEFLRIERPLTDLKVECLGDAGEECRIGYPWFSKCGGPMPCSPSEGWATLLANLLVEADRAPGSEYVIGQAVYALGKIGDWRDAARVVGTCEAERWWCASLAAWVAVRGDNGSPVDMAQVESDLVQALKEMPPLSHCHWTQTGPLFKAPDDQDYQRKNCMETADYDARVWWLADPLYSVPGNERYLEHLLRAIEARLYLDFRDRGRSWDGLESTAGNPLMSYQVRSALFPLTRDGWPDSWSTVSYGEQHRPDRGNGQWVSLSKARYKLIPARRAIEDPLFSRTEDWDLEQWDNDELPTPERFSPAMGALLEMDWQARTFERGDEMLVVVAGDVPTETRADEEWLFEAPATPAWGVKTGALVLTGAPGRIDASSEDPADRDRYVLSARVPSGRYIAGLEVLSLPRVAARVRGSVGPPTGADDDPSDPVRASAPLFFHPDAQLPVLSAEEIEPEVAFAGMIGGPSIEVDDRLALYWEVYGPKSGTPEALQPVEVHVTLDMRVRGSRTTLYEESLVLGPAGTDSGMVRRATQVGTALRAATTEFELRIEVEGGDNLTRRVTLEVEESGAGGL